MLYMGFYCCSFVHELVSREKCVISRRTFLLRFVRRTTPECSGGGVHPNGYASLPAGGANREP